MPSTTGPHVTADDFHTFYILSTLIESRWPDYDDDDYVKVLLGPQMENNKQQGFKAAIVRMEKKKKGAGTDQQDETSEASVVKTLLVRTQKAKSRKDVLRKLLEIVEAQLGDELSELEVQADNELYGDDDDSSLTDLTELSEKIAMADLDGGKNNAMAHDGDRDGAEAGPSTPKTKDEGRLTIKSKPVNMKQQVSQTTQREIRAAIRKKAKEKDLGWKRNKAEVDPNHNDEQSDSEQEVKSAKSKSDEEAAPTAGKSPKKKAKRSRK